MMCAMFIILVAFASVKMAFDSVPLALFSRASGLIGTEYTSKSAILSIVLFGTVFPFYYLMNFSVLIEGWLLCGYLTEE